MLLPRIGAFLLLAGGSLLFAGEQTAADRTPPTVTAVRLAQPIRVDGRLDDPAWKEARSAELTQQSPRPGESTHFRTTVRALVTDTALYVGFECIDPEPARIAIHTLQRDGEVEGDDTVAVVLDTHRDRRTGFFFRTNAAGARVDGLISDPEHPSTNWDGIWNVRTARSDKGWSAEFEIPSRTLSFGRGLTAWGVNFERSVARDRVVLRWSSATLDSFLYDLSRAGTLEGIDAMSQGLGLEVSPYGVTRFNNSRTDNSRVWTGDPGVDVTYRVTPQLATILTVNTDFAETEVDSRQINITRFPLFFPEKRTFFLEGSNQFEFGLGLGSTFIPFFSRRVGLYQGRAIPLDAGFKLQGGAGNWNLGFLDVQTHDTDLAPGTNLLAGRASYDVGSRLRLGTIVTSGHPDGVSRNSLAGFDAVWRTSAFRGNKNLLAGAWTAFSAGDIPSGRANGWGFKLDYPNDLWDCSLTYNEFGDALEPALGFLPRSGVRHFRAGADYMPRPSKQGPFRWVRQQFFENSFVYYQQLGGPTESWLYHAVPVHVRMESGDSFEFGWSPQYEYLREPFEIAEGIVIPAGSYRFNRWQIEAESSDHRPVQAGLDCQFGSFYGGDLAQWETFLRWTSPAGRLQAGLGLEQNFGRLPQGNFVQRLWQMNFAYAFNPNFVLTSFLQYDTESQEIGNNLRLRWTIRPGNDLFFVWNRGWRRLLQERDDPAIVPESDMIALKLRWTFRR